MRIEMAREEGNRAATGSSIFEILPALYKLLREGDRGPGVYQLFESLVAYVNGFSSIMPDEDRDEIEVWLFQPIREIQARISRGESMEGMSEQVEELVKNASATIFIPWLKKTRPELAAKIPGVVIGRA